MVTIMLLDKVSRVAERWRCVECFEERRHRPKRRNSLSTDVRGRSQNF